MQVIHPIALRWDRIHLCRVISPPVGVELPDLPMWDVAHAHAHVRPRSSVVKKRDYSARPLCWLIELGHVTRRVDDGQLRSWHFIVEPLGHRNWKPHVLCTMENEDPAGKPAKYQSGIIGSPRMQAALQEWPDPLTGELDVCEQGRGTHPTGQGPRSPWVPLPPPTGSSHQRRFEDSPARSRPNEATEPRQPVGSRTRLSHRGTGRRGDRPSSRRARASAHAPDVPR